MLTCCVDGRGTVSAMIANTMPGHGVRDGGDDQHRGWTRRRMRFLGGATGALIGPALRSRDKLGTSPPGLVEPTVIATVALPVAPTMVSPSQPAGP